MSTTKTKSRKVNRRSSRSSGRSPRRGAAAALRRDIKADEHAYVMSGNTPTHVLIPIDEYEQMLVAEMVLKVQERDEQQDLATSIDFEDWVIREAGHRVAAARKAKGVTQRQLGEKLGIAQTQISRIERNPDRTSLGTLKRIAKALGVDIRELVA